VRHERLFCPPGDTVLLSWAAATDEHGITSYQIQRRANLSASFATVGSTAALSYTDNGVTPQTTYQYQVLALDTSSNPSAPSNRDLATTITYLDDPLIPESTLVRATHIMELRTATNSIRLFAGLPAASWTDASLVGMSVQALHVEELRTRLGEALGAIGVTTSPYTDPTLAANSTMIRAVHMTELRGNTK
jgi:hypothetical protein